MRNVKSYVEPVNLRDYPYTHRIDDRYVNLPNGISLRTVSFYPKQKTAYPPLVMMTGLVSVMQSSKDIVKYLNRDFEIHYLETREKSSSITNGQNNFSIVELGRDISLAIPLLGLGDRKYLLFGASLGATAIIEAYRQLKTRPLALILLEPNASFRVPFWSLPLVHLSPHLYRILKPMAKYYIKHYRINIKEDYEMYRISARAIDAADPVKLRGAVLGLIKYKVWDLLEEVDCPTLIVGASKDHFHRHEHILKMSNIIKECTFADLENHERTHSDELAGVIKKFVNTHLQTRQSPIIY